MPSACRVGDSLDPVQRADAVEAFMREVERFDAMNMEQRPISRDEWDDTSPRGDE
jgi:hypothetical protein